MAILAACTARLAAGAARGPGLRRGACQKSNLLQAPVLHGLIAARASSRRQPDNQQSPPLEAFDDGASHCMSTNTESSIAESSRESSSTGTSSTLLAVAEVAAIITAVPLVLPTAAAASSILATLVPHSLQQHQSWETLYCGFTAVGAASLLVTLVCTSRFLVSYYPSLEREAEQQRWRMPWMAVTLFDPLLQPLRRRFFGQTEEGDLDFAAVALLAVVCSLLECLVGKDGLVCDWIPDFGLQAALQYLIIFQHGFLLPIWVLVVLRWGRVI